MLTCCHHQLGDNAESGSEVGWRFANMSCDDALEMGVTTGLQTSKHPIADTVDLCWVATRLDYRISGVLVGSSLGHVFVARVWCGLVKKRGDFYVQSHPTYVPQRRQKQINVSDTIDLRKKEGDVVEQLGRVVVVENIHVDTLGATAGKRQPVLFGVNM